MPVGRGGQESKQSLLRVLSHYFSHHAVAPAPHSRHAHHRFRLCAQCQQQTRAIILTILTKDYTSTVQINICLEQ